MPKVKTLYQICIETLVLKSAYIEDLSGIPFEPYILDLLNYLFTYKISHMATPMKRLTTSWKFTSIQNLLGRIGDAHGAILRQPKYVSFGSLRLTVGYDPGYMLEKYAHIISQPGGAPQFITQLDLSMSWFDDYDVPHLKHMVNLMVLDLSATLITDNGVSDLCRFTQLQQQQDNNNTRVGLPYLETISLAYNKSITDKSLKFLRQMETLWGIDLSTTNVDQHVATIVLKQQNYVCNDESLPLTRRTPATAAATAAARAWHREKDDERIGIKDMTYMMHEDQRKKLCPVHPLTLITHHGPFPYSNDNPQNQRPEQKDERKGVATTNNEHMYLLLTNDDSYGATRHSSYDVNSELWWERMKRSPQPLVFTRPPLVTENSTESNVGKKRSFQIMVNGGGGGGVNTKALPLLVKQSQTASSFIENFQW